MWTLSKVRAASMYTLRAGELPGVQERVFRVNRSCFPGKCTHKLSWQHLLFTKSRSGSAGSRRCCQKLGTDGQRRRGRGHDLGVVSSARCLPSRPHACDCRDRADRGLPASVALMQVIIGVCFLCNVPPTPCPPHQFLCLAEIMLRFLDEVLSFLWKCRNGTIWLTSKYFAVKLHGRGF